MFRTVSGYMNKSLWITEAENLKTKLEELNLSVQQDRQVQPRSNITMERDIWDYQGVMYLWRGRYGFTKEKCNYGEGDMGLPRSNVTMEREIWVFQGVI